MPWSALVEAATHCLLVGTLLSQTLRDAAAVALVILLVRERLSDSETDSEAALPATWFWPVATFLAVNALAAWASDDPRSGFQQLQFYPLGLLIFFGTRRTIADGRSARLAGVVLALVIVLALDSAWQFVHGTSFLKQRLPMWGRFQGALLYPSDVSLLTILLPLGAMALAGAGTWRLLIGAFALVLVTTAVSLSGTRSAWCALLLVAAAGWTPRRARVGFALVALALVVSVATVSLGRATAPKRLFSAQTYRDEKRVTQWRAAVYLFRQAPVLGQGPHSFRRIIRARRTDPVIARVNPEYAPYPHDIYLEALCGTGVLGFAALLWLLARGFRALYAARRAAPIARAALVSLTAFAAVGLFDLSLARDWVQLCFWLPLGIAAGQPPRREST